MRECIKMKREKKSYAVISLFQTHFDDCAQAMQRRCFSYPAGSRSFDLKTASIVSHEQHRKINESERERNICTAHSLEASSAYKLCSS